MHITRQIVGLMALSVGLMTTYVCAAYTVRTMNDPVPRYYPGMRDDARMIVQPSQVTWAAYAVTERVIFGALDILPSTVIDTLCLPIEVTMPPSTNSPAHPTPEAGGVNEIQGIWKVVTLEADGRQAPAEVVAALTLVFKNDTLMFVPGEPGFTNYRYRLDPAAEPPVFTMIHADGSKKGEVETGIYRLERDRLEICFGAANQIPKTFTAEPQSGQALYILVRKK